jgi:Flp pilus assembly protein TadG
MSPCPGSGLWVKKGNRMAKQSERGAVAVEFALLLPVLLVLVVGIVEFGRAYNTQITLTHAAREGVRVMAIRNDPEAAKTRTVDSAVGLNPALQTSDVTIVTNGPNTAVCSTGATATLTVKYTVSTLSGMFGPFTLTGKGVMRCGG